MAKDRMTPDERHEYGRSLRAQAPLEAHADCPPAGDRPDPVQLVEEQNENRLPWLVPVRRARMSVSAFTFYRGSARIMASDLAKTPVSGLQAQICGDAHLSNFGAYASPERRLVFDINDFDETLPGPWEWDLKRLAASFVIAGRHNGLGRKDAKKLARRCVRVYRRSMRKLADTGLLDVWYELMQADEVIDLVEDHADRKKAAKAIRKAQSKDSRHALSKLAEEVSGDYRIKSNPPFLIPLRDIARSDRETVEPWLHSSFERYLECVPDHMEHLLRQYAVKEYAMKVVGVGSVGTRCAILLLEGRDRHDPLLLQIKEANPSVLEEFLPRSRYESTGQRVVEGQRLMQTVSDIFLGWTVNEKSGNEYYWRQLKDWKGSVDVEAAGPSRLAVYATTRGWTLARAHARSGDPIAIAGYMGDGKTFDKAIAEFASRYAEQNDLDYAAFRNQIDNEMLETVELE